MSCLPNYNWVACINPEDSGTEMSPAVRHLMEDAFWTDFSEIRLHRMCPHGRLNYSAFCLENHLFFGTRATDPESPQGRRFLGHELAHVLQQRTGIRRESSPTELTWLWDAALEAEAETAGELVTCGQPVPPISPRAQRVFAAMPSGSLPIQFVFDASSDPIWRKTTIPTVIRNSPLSKSYDNHYVKYTAGVLNANSTNGFIAAIFNDKSIPSATLSGRIVGHIQLLTWLKPWEKTKTLGEKFKGIFTKGPTPPTVADTMLQPQARQYLKVTDTEARGYAHQMVWQDPVSKWGVDVHPASPIVSPVFQLANVTSEDLSDLPDAFAEAGCYNGNRLKAPDNDFRPVLGDTPRAQNAELLFWTIACSFPIDPSSFDSAKSNTQADVLRRALANDDDFRLHAGFKWLLQGGGTLTVATNEDDSLSELDQQIIRGAIQSYRTHLETL